jgi:predicted nucleic acid-binding protein
MSGILADTSVWIDYFNGKNPKADILSDLIDSNAVCTNDLVLTELVPFIKLADESRLVDLLRSIKNITLKIDWGDLLMMQMINLRNGLNRIGIPDLIIVQNVIQNDLTLFTFDGHFKSMQRLHKFKLYEI